MTNSIFNMYSEVYSVALMQNVKTTKTIASANKTGKGRFGALVKLLRRG